jgi:hypothetical protein
MTSSKSILESELRAVEKSDDEYYRQPVRDRDATLAFLLRQSRRREILEQIMRDKAET